MRVLGFLSVLSSSRLMQAQREYNSWKAETVKYIYTTPRDHTKLILRLLALISFPNTIMSTTYSWQSVSHDQLFKKKKRRKIKKERERVENRGATTTWSHHQVIPKEVENSLNSPTRLSPGPSQALRGCQQRCPTQRAGVVILIMLMIVIYPSINAIPVEHVAAIPQLSDLILIPQLAQADSTCVTNSWHPLCDITESGQDQTVPNLLRRRNRMRLP